MRRYRLQHSLRSGNDVLEMITVCISWSCTVDLWRLAGRGRAGECTARVPPVPPPLPPQGNTLQVSAEANVAILPHLHSYLFLFVASCEPRKFSGCLKRPVPLLDLNKHLTSLVSASKRAKQYCLRRLHGNTYQRWMTTTIYVCLNPRRTPLLFENVIFRRFFISRYISMTTIVLDPKSKKLFVLYIIRTLGYCKW